LEKREAAVHQLNAQIEGAEQSQVSEKSNAEENRRRVDEEKARKVREENERRRKEEEEEERKKRETEEERRRQMVVNSPTYTGGQDKPALRPRAATTAVGWAPATNVASPPQVKQQSSLETLEEGVDPEELRLMRAMTRKAGAPTAPNTNRASMYKPEVKAVAPPKQTQEPAWKEQERSRETERLARVAEESRRKDDERRINQDRQAQEKLVEDQAIAAIHTRDGITHTFISPTIYDFEADIKICGDFTDWREVPITTDMDNKNFSYSITLPVTRGLHYYRFRVAGKWDVNRNLPTGVAPTGELMNKVDI